MLRYICCVLSILNWTSSVKILWFICDYLLKTLSHFSTGGQHYVTNPRRCWSKCYWELITLLSQLWSRYIDINQFLSWCARTENIIPGDFLWGMSGGSVNGQFCLIRSLLLFIFGDERKSVDPIIVSREYFRWGMKFPTHFVYSYK